jgi:hypothetical protein
MPFSKQVINTLLSLFTVWCYQNTQKRKQLMCSKEGEALKRQLAGNEGHFDGSPDPRNSIHQPIPHDPYTRGAIECDRSEPKSS